MRHLVSSNLRYSMYSKCDRILYAHFSIFNVYSICCRNIGELITLLVIMANVINVIVKYAK